MINGNLFRDMIISGAASIENQKEAINKLNVFPVPDGDTGTNMSLTIGSAARDIADCDDLNVSEIADKVAFSLLKGARGNSGVILSLIFRGLAKSIKGKDEISGIDLANALLEGSDTAYKAVMKPTEGTILTVIREGATECIELCEDNEEIDPIEVMKVFIEEANASLERTPDLLPALKQAGVVDAGGKGLITVFEGAFEFLTTGTIVKKEVKEDSYKSQANFADFNPDDIKFTYCTEFIVCKDEKAKDKESENLKTYLENIGDSVVCVDADGIIKVHVHTNHPGKAFEKGLNFGYLVNMKIDNMKEEHSENANKMVDDSKPLEEVIESLEEIDAPATKPFGFVSVCAGSGLADIFRDLGADTIVEGGQTMNPSTEDIIEAVRKTPSHTVFVLPNNKNIIMAASQAIGLVDGKEIVVLETKTIPQGVSSMLFFDPESPKEDNINNMVGAISNVKSGQITYAARDSVFDDKEIKEGQFLGMCEGKVSFVEDEINGAMQNIINDLSDDNTEIITLFYGEDVSSDEAEKMREFVESLISSDIEVTLLKGDQPVYYYLVSVE